MSGRIAIAWAVIVTASVLAQHHERTLWQEVLPNARSAVRVIDDAAFKDDRLAALCAASNKGGEFTFVQWLAITSGKHAQLVRPMHFETFSFARFEKTHLVAQQLFWKAALCVHSPRGSLIRIRDGEEVVDRVLSGYNPLIYNYLTGQLRILQISLQASSVVVFAESAGTPDESAAKELFRQMKQVFPTVGIEVYLRSDPWFITDTRYYAFNPFVIAAVPAQRIWAQAPFSRCSDLSGRTNCTSYP
jgi:hypothetical protein